MVCRLFENRRSPIPLTKAQLLLTFVFSFVVIADMSKSFNSMELKIEIGGTNKVVAFTGGE
jgi:hypothetical protein